MASVHPPTGEETIDLLAGDGEGSIWRIESTDLVAVLMVWPGAHEVAEHVHDDTDALIVVLGGSGTAFVDGRAHAMTPGNAILFPRGARRAIRADDGGMRYLKVLRHPDT